MLPLSLMPKGVEHMQAWADWIDAIGLPLSLMPKGVEHSMMILRSSGCRAAVIPDAERR